MSFCWLECYLNCKVTLKFQIILKLNVFPIQLSVYIQNESYTRLGHTPNVRLTNVLLI